MPAKCPGCAEQLSARTIVKAPSPWHITCPSCGMKLRTSHDAIYLTCALLAIAGAALLYTVWYMSVIGPISLFGAFVVLGLLELSGIIVVKFYGVERKGGGD